MQRLIIAREGSGAIVGAGHALRGVGFGTVGAQRASAIGADGDGFGMVRETFHGVDGRSEAASRLAEMQIRTAAEILKGEKLAAYQFIRLLIQQRLHNA